MSAKVASDIMVYFDKSTTEVPDYVALGGQTGASLSQSTETHDILVKSSLGEPLYRKYLPGAKEWSVEMENLFFFSDEATSLFEQAYLDNKEIKLEIRTTGNTKYVGNAIIESMDFEFNTDSVATFSASLVGSGKLEKVVTP